MLSETFKMMDRLAPLHKSKSPGAAAVLGFVLGGVGLGIYLRSFIDFLAPVGLVIAASVLSTGFASLDPQVGVCWRHRRGDVGLLPGRELQPSSHRADDQWVKVNAVHAT